MMIKRRWIRRGAALLGLILMAQMAFPAYAEFSADQTGSVDVTVKVSTDTGTATPLENVEFTAYQIAEAAETEGTVSFTVVNTDLSDYEESLNQLAAAGTAADDENLELAATILKSISDGSGYNTKSQTTGTDGTLAFTRLNPGAWLIAQTNTLTGYQTVDPRIVFVPASSTDASGDYTWEQSVSYVTERFTDWDLSETGTITATVVSVSSSGASEAPLSGVGLSLYRVASAAVSDGVIRYTPVSVLSGYEDFFNGDFSSASAASKASEIVYKTDLSSYLVTTLTTGTDGSVEFDELDAGIYLVYQTGTVDGYVSTTPYLIKLPEIEGNDLLWEYELTMTTEASDGTAEEWDLSKAGTLTVNAGYVSTGTDRTPVAGAEFTVYQVATVTVSNGNVYYVAVDALAAYESQMNSATTTDSYSELASALAAVIAGDDTLAAQLKIGTQESGTDGNAVFESVMSGMYLIVQTNTISGYESISPFIACLPTTSEDGTGWDYSIQALPKLEKSSTSGGNSSSGGHSSGGSSGGSSSSSSGSSSSSSGGPGTGGSSGNPSDGGGPSGELFEISSDSTFLPQTGLRRSIVSFLAIGGIFFIALGWRLGVPKH